MVRSRTAALLVMAATFAFLVLAARLGAQPSAAQTTALCVRPSGFGCYATIGAALAVAQAGDVIRVAAGDYAENLVITRTVVLEGGWNSQFTVRDPAANVTTIRPSDPTHSVIQIQGLIVDSAAVAPTLDGFTVTGGRGDLGGSHGGGIAIRDSDAIVRSNIITGNVGYLLGGGVWVQRGAPRLDGNRIVNNRADGQGQGSQGGGVELEATRALLTGNIVSGNVLTGTTGQGGGISVSSGGPVTLTGNLVSGNGAAIAVTGVSNYGGGIRVSDAQVTLSQNLIQANSANSLGPGLGGGLSIQGSPAFTLTGNTIISNTAGMTTSVAGYLRGGGVLVESSNGILSGNSIVGNRANRNTVFGSGGGLAVTGSTLKVQGGRIADNSVSVNCEGYGGGLYAVASQVTIDAVRIENNCAANTPFYGLGGALAFDTSPFTLTNSLLVRNDAFPNDTSVGGVWAAAGSPGLLVNNSLVDNKSQALRSAAPVTLTNDLIVGSTTGISLTASGLANATYNAFYNNTTNERGFTLGVTNIVIDPKLDADYHLTAASPLIDSGTRVAIPARDIDGESRFMAGPSGLFRPDIGADERTGPDQRYVDLAYEPPDLMVIGPGDPPENPGTGMGPNDYIGTTVLGADVNGDGRADLLTAANDWAEQFNGGGGATGRVFGLFNFGRRLTGTIDLLTSAPSLNVISKYPDQHVGQSFAAADLNADGRADLIVGSTQTDNATPHTPTVFVLFGSPALAGTRVLTNPTPADFALVAPAPDFFAFANLGALTTGDLNGDGVPDLIVGDGLADDGSTSNSGAVFVVYGGSGLTGRRDLAASPADATVYGPAADAGLERVATGRLNGDGQIDLAARSDAAAYVLFGPLSGTHHLASAPADVTVTGLQPGVVEVVDLTGDGQDDLVLGSGSSLYVVPGPFTAGQSFGVASRAVLTITGVTARAVATGQVAGDTRPDLIVGATDGKTYVFTAGLAARGTVAALDIASEVVAGAGKDVSAGDLDLDGRPDLILGQCAGATIDHPMYFEDAGTTCVVYAADDVQTVTTPGATPTPTATPTPANSATATSQAATATAQGATATAQAATATASAISTPGQGTTPVPFRDFLPALLQGDVAR